MTKKSQETSDLYKEEKEAYKALWQNDFNDRAPTILVNIEHDDPNRGDTKGRIGLAHAIARKTGAQVLYADQAKMEREYPNVTQTQNLSRYETQLAQYLGGKRQPQLVLGVRADKTLETLGYSADASFFNGHINETLSRDLLDNYELVPHHLNEDVLSEAKEEFHEQYPDVTGKVISIMMASVGTGYAKDIARKLEKTFKHFEDATIFICGSRRTSESEQQAVFEELEKTVNKHNESRGDGWFQRGGQVNVINAPFDPKASYNPYKGLIAASDHFIVWGNSYSLVSEALYAGKTVHLYHYPNQVKDIKKKNYVREFNGRAAKNGFMTREFEPVDLTDQLADKLLEKFEEQFVRSVQYIKDGKTPEVTKEQHELIQSLKYGVATADVISDEMLEDRVFVCALLSEHPKTLFYLPEEMQKDPELAGMALAKSSFLGVKLHDDLKNSAEFMLRHITPSNGLYKIIGKDLETNVDFHTQLVQKNCHNFDNFPAKRQDERAVSLAYMQHAGEFCSFEDIAPKWAEDPIFRDEAYRKNIALYCHLSEGDQQQPKNIMRALTKAHLTYHELPDDKRSHPKVIRNAISGADGFSQLRRIMDAMPKEMFKKEEVMIQFLERESGMIAYIPPGQLTEGVAIAAVKNDRHCYASLPRAMKTNMNVLKATFSKEHDGYSNLLYDMPTEVYGDKKIMSELVKQPGFTLYDLTTALRNDHKFMKEAVKHRPEWLKHHHVFTAAKLPTIHKIQNFVDKII